LDIRGNRLTKIFLKEAVSFLKDTVVLMWDNPFEIENSEKLIKKDPGDGDENNMCEEYFDPASLFRSG
jgi:hypothetical protein